MMHYVRVAFKSRGLDPDFDGYPICERCEAKRADDVDHINSRGKGKTSNKKNLIFLCRTCHINKGGYNWRKVAEAIVEAKITGNGEVI